VVTGNRDGPQKETTMRTYGTEIDPILRSDIDYGEDHTVKASKRNLGRNADGDMHNTFRSSAAKRNARRGIKRVARRDGKTACHNED
jgi:hypothetical protein